MNNTGISTLRCRLARTAAPAWLRHSPWLVGLLSERTNTRSGRRRRRRQGPHRQTQAGVTCALTAPALIAQAYLPCVRERTARDQALTAELHETKKVGPLRDLFCFSNGEGRGLRRRGSPWALVLALPALGHQGAFRFERGLRRLPIEGIGRTVCDSHASRLLPRS